MRFVTILQNSDVDLDQQQNTDLDQQKEQVHPQVNSNEPTINENNFSPGKPSPKINLYQLYRSKPSTNNSLELFIKILEKELFHPNNLKKTSKLPQ